MKIVSSPAQMAELSKQARLEGKTIAVVPTMGYLHEGHVSLIRRARKEAGFVVATLFVNPIQFGPGEDFAVYPRNEEHDAEICRKEGVDVLYMPKIEDMYHRDASVRVSENSLSRHLCGASRPGHFEGVCTVVAKLFNATRADKAVFGLKDAQQVAVIRRMVRDLDFPVEIIASPIVREEDGLAMSSRNARLKPGDREKALGLSRSIAYARDFYQKGNRDASSLKKSMHEMLVSSGLRPDYVSVVDYDTLEEENTLRPNTLVAAAAFCGDVRLIDNCIL